MSADTLWSVLEGGQAADPALVVPDGPSLTYAALRDRVAELADAFAAFGLGRGDRIATVLPNGAEAIVGFLAAAIAGTAAPLNPNYTEEEFRFYFDDTSAKAVVVPPGGAEAARRALPDGTLLIELAIGADGRLAVAGEAARPAGRTAAPPTGDDVALVLHTSGTTSRPKRVPLRHRNLAVSVRNIIETYALTPADIALCVMPLFHVHGLVASTLSTFGSGGTVVVPARFNPLGFWPIVKAHRATWYSAVPTLHQLVLARGHGRPDGVESLRFIRSCSSALPGEVMLQMEERYGVPVLEAYGMTEAAHQMASNPLPPDPRYPGSVGRGTGVRIGILDEQGNLLADGSPGEVVIQGPNVTDGYENNPSANAEAFTDGWFRTGDQGTLSSEGYLTLIGRIKELINRGGEKIAPREIDEVLQRHPAVAEAVSFGTPHPVWGEEVQVAVVTRPDATVTENELVRYCREHLADFKVPKKVYLVEAIPRTATGKIQRRNVAQALGALG